MEAGTLNLRRFACAATLAVVMLWPAAALGHGDTATTDPEDGATLKRAPKSVSVTLTEAPAEGAEFVVTDGCGRKVSGDPTIDGDVLSAATSGGESGKWKARFRVVSAVDGHLTKDEFRFTVAGKKDCSKDEPKPSNNDRGNNGGEGNSNNSDPTSANDTGDEEGSSFPVVPVAAGTGLLVAVALFIRTRSAG
jgi:methionine-rich copper-binding protein CopC